MAKEELEKYAHENRKRLDAQEVKIGDVVKVLRGQFADETGVVVGIIACIGDYTDPYYEVNMDCDVPEKYKCRKSFISPNNVIGGLSAYDFEVIGNRAPMQSTEEVKVGNKVRIADNVPEMYTQTVFSVHIPMDMEVLKVQDGSAHITPILSGAGGLSFEYIIPTKYLTKVEDEAKEPKPKYKLGDFVRVDYIRMNSNEVYSVLDRRYSEQGWIYEINIHEWVNEMWLIPHTKPTEVVSQEEMTNELDPAEHKVMPALDYWEQYTADLAKEIALKVANKHMDGNPEGIGAYAVSVAKAVVESLKKK